jgi:hypothetical protein
MSIYSYITLLTVLYFNNRTRYIIKYIYVSTLIHLWTKFFFKGQKVVIACFKLIRLCIL